jgi:chromosome segregation ATPase
VAEACAYIERIAPYAKAVTEERDARKVECDALQARCAALMKERDHLDDQLTSMKEERDKLLKEKEEKVGVEDLLDAD